MTPSTVKLPAWPEQVAHVHSNGDFCADRQITSTGWPVNLFTEEQMEAFATSAVLEAIERCASIADEWSKPDVLRLAAGEMTTQEMRTAQAVARGIAAAIRSLAGERKGV